MSVYGLKPIFVDQKGYKAFMKLWKNFYNSLTERVKLLKQEKTDHIKHYLMALSRIDPNAFPKDIEAIIQCSKMARELTEINRKLEQVRSTASKMMMIRQEAKDRKARLVSMKKEIANQPFPITENNCSNVDFHYNKGHNEFKFLPQWCLRIKGKTFYVNEVNANVAWTTHERASGSTVGVLRFPKCNVVIDKKGIAKISA